MWHTLFTNRQNVSAPKGPSSVEQEYKTELNRTEQNRTEQNRTTCSCSVLYSYATEGGPFGAETFCLLIKSVPHV